MKQLQKKYAIPYKMDYQPFYDEAKSKWLGMNPFDPDWEDQEVEIAGIAYTMIVKSTDIPFNHIASLLRSFHDSSIDVQYEGFEYAVDNRNKPEKVIYNVIIILTAEAPKDHPLKAQDEWLSEQILLNQHFIEKCNKFEFDVKSEGIV